MKFFKPKRAFLDYAAGEDNPSAIYKEGVLLKKALEEARTHIARLLHVQSKEIIFTSGGTEADNLALLGVYEAMRAKVLNPHFVITSIEHSAIKECAKEIIRRGGEVTVVEAEQGVVSAELVLKSVKENTVLVSVMYANNETGSIQPIAKISRGLAEIRKKNNSLIPYVHTDATQAPLYLSVDLSRLGVDMLTLDASKIYGPKSTGLLIARKHVEIRPIIFGGGQEQGLRSGTENVSNIKLFAQALESAQKNIETESLKINKFKDLFINELKKSIPEAIVNTKELSLPNIVSVTIPNAIHEFLAIKLDAQGVCVSTGSSCDSNKNDFEKQALRFSFGRKTQKSDIKKAISLLKKSLENLEA